MTLWRLHLRPEPKNGKTWSDVVAYCITSHVAGIGWPVDGNPQTTQEYRIMAEKTYGTGISSLTFAEQIRKGDLIWARALNGLYYLGRIGGDGWRYRKEDEELDIPNQHDCRWVSIPNENFVPGKVVACFRPSRTLQRIVDSTMETFSEWIYNNPRGMGQFLCDTPLTDLDLPASTFFEYISSDDCEDILALYLQKEKDYLLIPSTCKRTTIGYEFIFKHKISGKTASVQVKQGNVDLGSELTSTADDVFLLTTQGRVDVAADNVHIVDIETLFAFVKENQTILPDRILFWLRFKMSTDLVQGVMAV